MNDAELRERFAQWTDPLRAAPPPPVATIRRRARRHAANLAVTSGLVLAVVGLTAGLVASGLVATARPPDASARYPAPPGQPYVLVIDPATCPTSSPCTTLSGGRTELRDAATGAVLDVLRPHAGSVIAVAAAANDRLFVLGEQAYTGQISFAELRITVSDGRASVRLTPVLSRVHVPWGSQLISMTVNAAGTRLALSTLPDGPGNVPSLSSLNVYDLSTGTLMESWRPPGLSISHQQFIGGADELAVFWPTSSAVTTVSGDRMDVHETQELRLVDTAAAFRQGSSLLADSRADRAVNGEVDGSFSPDGSVALNSDAGGLESTPPGPTADLLETDALSGRLLRTVPLGPASVLNHSEFCGVLWASANGRDLLTQCGTRQLWIVNGKASVVHLAWMFQAGSNVLMEGQSAQPILRGYQLAYFAW